MHHSIGSADSSTLVGYAITCLVLSLNLLLLWVSSGAIRAKSAIAINPEDGARYGAPVSDVDPPAVARILRVHGNAEATTYPFLFIGLIYVLAGGGPGVAVPIFSIFTLPVSHIRFFT